MNLRFVPQCNCDTEIIDFKTNGTRIKVCHMEADKQCNKDVNMISNTFIYEENVFRVI